MEAQQIENVIQSNISVLLGEYGWMFLAALAVLFFKTTIESTIAGLLIFCGNDYNNDDIVILEELDVHLRYQRYWWLSIIIFPSIMLLTSFNILSIVEATVIGAIILLVLKSIIILNDL